MRPGPFNVRLAAIERLHAVNLEAVPVGTEVV
jgi:hypothetical protein